MSLKTTLKSNQLYILAVLGFITFWCILGKSLTPLWLGLILFVMIASGRRCFHALSSHKKNIRIAGIIGCVSLAVLIFGTALNTLERTYLVQGSSYPAFLGTDVGIVNLQKVIDLHETKCPGMGTSTFRKNDDIVVIRCGNSWLGGKTFIGHVLDSNWYEGVVK